MKKKLLSLLLTFSLLCPVLTIRTDASFTDIQDPDTALAAGVLQSMGIADGVGDGRYSPDTVLTRAQFCTFMIHTLGRKDQVNTYALKTLFTDVKPGNWYTGYVNLAYSQGLLSGYGNGKFGPDDPVTYGQAATLLLRILGYTSQDIGKVWPADYINYAHTLELDDKVSLGADEGVTRAQAALLLYNTLRAHPKGGQNEYYKTFGDTASVQKAIVLDVNTDHGTASGQLMACVVSAGGTSIEYFNQKNPISDILTGYEGDLLLNQAGKVLGFVPGSTRTQDIVISSAKASGITTSSGTVLRITGSAATIVGDEIFSWNTTGHIKVNALSGKTARLFYDDDGTVSYVYVATGTGSLQTQAMVAQTDTAHSELARRLGLTGTYSITKNGAAAHSSDLARYDTAYYDKATNTLRASDYQLTGYLHSAQPALDAPQTITIAGCTLSVLESAWDSLSGCRLGQRVTLFVTDDCKVAAATTDQTAAADMLGVLSTDGSSITLAGSGLTLTAQKVNAASELYGKLVKVYAYEDSLTCSPYTSDAAGRLNMTDRTLGSRDLAPACSIYEAADDAYVYSLGGELGVPSSDFEDIFWTDTLPVSDITAYHVNSAGKVDLILLKNVTGNCYQYGKLNRFTDNQGIVLNPSSPRPVQNPAATLINGTGTSRKHLCSFHVSTYNAYHGVALHSYNDTYQEVTSLITLNQSPEHAGSDFSLSDGDWYATVDHYEIPVSPNVQIYIEPTEQWLNGQDAIPTAVASGMSLTLFYDRTPTTGAQVRVIVAR